MYLIRLLTEAEAMGRHARRLMKRSHFLHQLGAASAALALSSCRSMLPDATRPMRTLSYAPKAGGKAEELVVLLPGCRLLPLLLAYAVPSHDGE